LISECLANSVTALTAIIFVFPISVKLTPEDTEVVEILRKFFGDHLANNTFLCFSKTENLTDAKLDELTANFMKDPNTKFIRDFAKAGVLYSGALSKDTRRDLAPELWNGLVNTYLPRLTRRRLDMIKKICALENQKLPENVRKAMFEAFKSSTEPPQNQPQQRHGRKQQQVQQKPQEGCAIL